MSKSRRERRRQRVKTEAKRLRRFEAALEVVLPPKGVVGPIERLWRIGKISDEQFWVSTRYAAAFEATLPDSILKAASFECIADGYVDRGDFFERTRLGNLYRWANVTMLERLQLWGLQPETPAVLLATAAHKIAFDDIDEKLRKRKSWARDATLWGLAALVNHWSFDISQARKRAESEGSTFV